MNLSTNSIRAEHREFIHSISTSKVTDPTVVKVRTHIYGLKIKIAYFFWPWLFVSIGGLCVLLKAIFFSSSEKLFIGLCVVFWVWLGITRIYGWDREIKENQESIPNTATDDEKPIARDHL